VLNFETDCTIMYRLLKAHSAKEKMRYKNMFANSTESSMTSEDSLKTESQDNGADTVGSS
jgi:hypothetical protein